MEGKVPFPPFPVLRLCERAKISKTKKMKNKQNKLNPEKTSSCAAVDTHTTFLCNDDCGQCGHCGTRKTIVLPENVRFAYINMNGRVYYIDDSTNEAIMMNWVGHCGEAYDDENQAKFQFEDEMEDLLIGVR